MGTGSGGMLLIYSLILGQIVNVPNNKLYKLNVVRNKINTKYSMYMK